MDRWTVTGLMTVDDPDADLPLDVDRRTGRLMTVAELQAALLMVRDGLPMAAPPVRPPATVMKPPVRPDREIFSWGGGGLPSVSVTAAEAAGFVVGASGGSGESLLAELLTGADTRPAAGGPGRTFVATGHHWPFAGEVVRVVLCARTNLTSLRAAQRAAAQWGTGHLDQVDLVGLVLMADAPGREPKPISEFAQVLAGGVPRLWRIPWIGDWRLGPPDPVGLPRAVAGALADILSALPSTTTSTSTT